MNVLCTFPGRAGDLLWALPTVRSVSERVGQPVDLLIAGEFAGMIPLLREQPYLGTIVALEGWSLSQDWQPPMITTDWDQVFHLGYRRWPENALPIEIYLNLADPTICDPPDLTRPWITLPPLPNAWGKSCIPVGFTEAWFELKYGLLKLLEMDLEYTPEREAKGQPTTALMQMAVHGGRWHKAGWSSYTWLEAAEFIAASDLFFGDCSALHVLAVASGKRVILMEPMEARWNPIFYPLGMDGPQVRVVKGNDGRPTFDARHCADVLREELQRVG